MYNTTIRLICRDNDLAVYCLVNLFPRIITYVSV